MPETEFLNDEIALQFTNGLRGASLTNQNSQVMKKKNNYPWPNWMGIRGFYFVWRGEWSDPAIVWHGYVMNKYDIEDVVWEQFRDYADERGIEKNDDNFVRFCKKETWRLRDAAQDCIDCGSARRILRGVFHYKNNFFGKDPFGLLALPAY